MNLNNVMDIAASGMSAQTIRLNTVASNLANANSQHGDASKVYRSKHPVFSSVYQQQLSFNPVSQQASSGVKVDEIMEDKSVLQRIYQPGHPNANKEGYVYQTNVSPITEMANMISASKDYQTNVEMMNTSKKLMLRTIDLLNS